MKKLFKWIKSFLLILLLSIIALIISLVSTFILFISFAILYNSDFSPYVVFILWIFIFIILYILFFRKKATKQVKQTINETGNILHEDKLAPNDSLKSKQSMVNEFKTSNLFWRYMVKIIIFTLLIIILVYLTYSEFAIISQILLLILLTLSIFLSLLYRSTIRRLKFLQSFNSEGIINRLFSGTILRIFIWIIIAHAMSWLLVIQFQFYNIYEWLIIFSVAPIFYLVFSIFRKLVKKETQQYLSYYYPISLALGFTPIIASLLCVIFIPILKPVPSYNSLEEVISKKKELVDNMHSMKLIKEISYIYSYKVAIEDYSINFIKNHIKYQSMNKNDTKKLRILLKLGIIFLFNLPLFSIACFLYLFLLIPWNEYGRIFEFSRGREDIPPPISKNKIFICTLFLVFSVIFIYIPLLGGLNFLLETRKYFESSKEKREYIEKGIKHAFRIIINGNDIYINQDGINKINKINKFYEKEIERINFKYQEHKNIFIDKTFDIAIEGIDPFLNWYYSLPAEYMRIINMFQGKLNEYIEAKLKDIIKEKLKEHNIDAINNEKYIEYCNKINKLINKYEKDIMKIVKKYKIDISYPNRDIIVDRSMENIIITLENFNMTKYNIGASVGGAATGGIFTAIITKKIVSKIAAKGTIKAAAKAFTKILGKKAMGKGLAALIGGGIGSVIPGAGTAAGAIVGGTLSSIVLGFTIDKMILELEEAFNREDFKKELIKIFIEAREEMKVETEKEFNEMEQEIKKLFGNNY